MPPNTPFQRAEPALHASSGAAVLDAAGWTSVRRDAAEGGSSGAGRKHVSGSEFHAASAAQAKVHSQSMAASAKDDMLHRPLHRRVRPRHYIKGVLIVTAAVCGHLTGRAFGKLLGIMLGLVLRRPFALASCLAVAAGLVTLWPQDEVAAPAPILAAPVSQPQPEPWTAINRPIAAYAVHAPELERLPRGYHARRHTSRAREDVLTYGTFAGDGLHARLVMHRDSDGAPPMVQSHFIDTARRAADAGLAVGRMAQATAVSTKFGTAEAADALLLEGSMERACLAFRLTAGENLLRISGWLCGTQARPADRSQLVCLMDRLSLVSAADDQPLKALFAAAERRRDQACSSSLITQAGRKLTWIDPNASAPPLRTVR